MSKPPTAFMRYARADDRHEGGWLTAFRERLSGEVEMHIADDFHIFQDREDIAWREEWAERIDRSLDSVTFLIPALTPRFFNSEPCRSALAAASIAP